MSVIELLTGTAQQAIDSVKAALHPHPTPAIVPDPPETPRQVASTAEAAVVVTGPVSAAKYCITGLQRVTGAPWWATLISCGVLFRVATWPLTVQQLKASKGLSRAYARAAAAVDKLKGDLPSPSAAASAAHLARTRRREVFALMSALRTRSGDTTHALWLAGPLTQIPVLICGIWAVADLAAPPPWPGLDTGGALWFRDLTASALEWGTMRAPMGMWGAVLPGLAAMMWRANLLRLFSTRGLPDRGKIMNVPVHLVHMGMLRLQQVAELGSIFILLAMLSAPQAPLLYLLTSMSSSMLLHQSMSLPAVRRAWRVDGGASAFRATADSELDGVEDDAAPSRAPRLARDGGLQDDSGPGRSSRSDSNDEPAGSDGDLYVQAMLRYVDGDYAAALKTIAKIQIQTPIDATAHFAAAQLHMRLQDWHAAFSTLQRAEELQPTANALQRGRIAMSQSRCAMRLKWHGRALKLAKKAVELRPADPLARIALLDAELQSGNIQAARAAAKQAAELDEGLDLSAVLGRIDKYHEAVSVPRGRNR